MELFIIKKKCKHYNNNIQIYANCCNKYYDCHKCHNKKENHKLDKNTIDKIKCIECKMDNTLGNSCKNCNISFSKYFCSKCRIWNEYSQDVYHCDKCNLCNSGNKDLYYHCDTCNLCISKNSKDTHVCSKKEINSECPICLDKIYNKKDNITLLRCHHAMHKNCYLDLIKHVKCKNIAMCTLCKKSVSHPLHFENKFDILIQNDPMPENYHDWKSNIFCNDCNEKGEVTYHFKYHKCNSCKSYNTTLLNIIK